MRQGMKTARATAVLMFFLCVAAPAPSADKPPPPRPPCCFVHPQYAGVCVVHPGKGETCASVLAYLNKPRSIGKSYCRNTTVRGGWTRLDCKTVRSATR